MDVPCMYPNEIEIEKLYLFMIIKYIELNLNSLTLTWYLAYFHKPFLEEVD